MKVSSPILKGLSFIKKDKTLIRSEILFASNFILLSKKESIGDLNYSIYGVFVGLLKFFTYFSRLSYMKRQFKWFHFLKNISSSSSSYLSSISLSAFSMSWSSFLSLISKASLAANPPGNKIYPCYKSIFMSKKNLKN